MVRRNPQEAVLYQLGLPMISDGPLQIIEREKGAKPLKFSQSRLELIAHYLDNPDLVVPNPRKIPLENHLNIVAGNIFHQIVQMTSLWRSARPADTRNYEDVYHHNLNELSGFMPSVDTNSRRMIQYVLTGLAMPKVSGMPFISEKRKIYRIISQRVTDLAKERPPFSDNFAFPNWLDDKDLFGELPFPQPDVFTAYWNRQGIEKIIDARVVNLFQYHENQVDLPPLAAQLGLYASELRFSGLTSGIVWSGRLDWIILGRPGIKIIDYKLNRPKFPPENTWQREALRIATWLTAHTAPQLPKRLRSDGRSVRISPDLSLPLDRHVEIIHMGFDSYPPSQINLSKYWKQDWSSVGLNQQMRHRLENFLDRVINDAPRLAPLLK